jgi:dUTP pyrophosphatase
MKFIYCPKEETDMILKKVGKPLTEFDLPTRSTSGSAGYDFKCPIDITIAPKYSAKIPLLVAVRDMPKDVVLLIFNRSSLALKHHLTIDNGVAVIDSDYKLCIWVQITNNGEEAYTFHINDKIAQGVFVNYVTVDNDTSTAERIGGIGSTGR